MPRRFATSIDIAAPADIVWEVMSDVERWHEWTASITSVRLLDRGPLAVGSRARIRQPRLPPATWLVTGVGPGPRFTWKSGNPLVRVVADHQVEPTPSGSRATLSIVYSGPLAGGLVWLTKDLNEQYLAMEAAGLKALAERRASARVTGGGSPQGAGPV